MDISSKVTGGSLTAAEFNQVVDELETTIQNTGISLSSGDLTQVSKSIANYISNGNFYIDSGAADAYVLSAGGSKKGITVLQDGQRIMFKVGNTNTGASTVNINGLGAKAITDILGNALSSGELVQNDFIELIYINASNHFRISNKTPIYLGKRITSIDNTDSPYTLPQSVQILSCDTSGGAITVNLPTAVNFAGYELDIVKTTNDLSLITVDPNGAETIDGLTTKLIVVKNERLRLYSNGVSWNVISHYIPLKYELYSSTIGGFTIGSQFLYWARQGKDLLLRGEFTTTAASGNKSFTMPSGLAIDTTVTTASRQHFGEIYNNDSNIIHWTIIGDNATSNTLYLGVRNYGAGADALSTTTTGNSVARYSVMARVPILNWD